MSARCLRVSRAGFPMSPRRLAVLAVVAAVAAGCTSAGSSADQPSIAVPATSVPAGPACSTGRPATGGDLLPDLTLPCLSGGGPVPPDVLWHRPWA